MAPNIKGAPAAAIAAPVAAAPSAQAFDPSVWVFGLWVVGSLGLVAYLAVQAIKLRGLLRRARALPQGPLAEEARRLGVDLGLGRRPEILVSSEVSAPMVVRPWRPVVVLPEAFDRTVEPAEATMALAHELAHVRRGDLWLAAVPALAQALLWFHPIAWLAAREWATERESACDADALVATGGSPAEYGRLLMKIVADDHRGALAPALGATAAYHTLRRRLDLMKTFVPRPNRALRLGGGAFAALALFAALPWEVVAQTPAAKPKEKNLLVNGDFENGLSGWESGSLPPGASVPVSVSVDSSAHKGKGAIRFTKTANGFFPVKLMAQSLPLTGHTTRLKVGAWIKAQGAMKATVAVIADGSANWGAYVGDSNSSKPMDHDWRYYSSVLEIPAGVRSLEIALQMYGPGTVWMDDLTVSYAPATTKVQEPQIAESDEDPLADVADVPNADLRAGNDPLKRYFLIGKPAATNKLVVVLPGGDGGEDFNPFLRRVWKNALPPGYLMAQVVAPKWSDDQASQLVWPTKKVRWTGMKFSTEELVEAVIKDVAAKNAVDPSKVYVLAWSSGGPAAYAAAMNAPSVKGAFVAMSVYDAASLPSPSAARGRAFYLLQSPEDAVTRYVNATTAQKELSGAGAKVTLTDYKGGHGWTEDPFGHIRKGMEWLEANAK